MLTVQKETTENGALRISAHTIKETIYPQQIIPMQYMTENYTHAHRDHPRTHAHKGITIYLHKIQCSIDVGTCSKLCSKLCNQ